MIIINYENCERMTQTSFKSVLICFYPFMFKINVVENKFPCRDTAFSLTIAKHCFGHTVEITRILYSVKFIKMHDTFFPFVLLCVQ